MLVDPTMGYLKLIIQVVVLSALFTLEVFIPYFAFGAGKIAHGLRNIGLGIFNGLLVALLFATLLAGVSEWSQEEGFGLIRWIGGPAWCQFLVALLAFDLWMYIWHRMNHRIGVLWRFHRVHHTDRALDATSALRFHTGEIIFSSIARLIIVPLLGMSLDQLILYEILLQPVILIHHSNIILPAFLDRILRTVIITPRVHWVHHSDRPEETDSNYGSIFSWWDRLARSFRLRDPKQIHYGLKEFADEKEESLLSLLKIPFKRGS